MTWYGTLIAWAKQIGRDPNRQPCKTLVKQVFEKLGQAAKGVDCPAIDGIIDEAEDVAGEVDNRSVIPRDRSPPFRLIHLPLWKTPWAPRCSKEVSHERRRLSGPASQHNLLAALCLGTTAILTQPGWFH
jgi:hypothetical protein